MKRDKLTYPRIKTIKPFFWRECRFCGREFKREIGYKIEDYTIINAHLYLSYCCNNCAKNIEDVKELVKKSKIIIRPSRMLSGESK